jgi:AraC family transcriptional activator of tynA and feaB
MRYVLRRRLENCRRDLTSQAAADLSTGEITFRWGFNDLAHFSRRFKQVYGCSPGEYRAGRDGRRRFKSSALISN